MRLNDSLIALLLIVLAVAVIAYASGFPPMPGQTFGPALFPTLIATGLIVAGLSLIVAQVRSGHKQPLLEVDAWVRTPRLLFDFLLVIGGLLFYILFSDELGYFIAAPLALAAFLFATGARALIVLPVAVVVPLIMHYIFYALLKVPLPWGLLTPYAW
jgi:putative tricarboxylic transport membrane protein